MRNVAFLFLASAVLVSSASAQSVITSAVHNGHTYSLLTTSTCTDAEAYAVNTLGGHLVTINDAAENQWVFDTFSNYGSEERNLWLGLNDVAVDGDYVWTSGETSSFRSWYPGEPNNNNTPGAESYVQMLRPGYGNALWNDAPNDATTYFNIGKVYGVVEVNAVPEPTSMVALGLGAFALLGRRKGRKA